MRYASCVAIALGVGLAFGDAQAQGASPLAEKLAEIAKRSELVHATFGVAAYDLDSKQMVFGMNAEQLFTPGSTTKLSTTGTALGLLGADYRFRTPVYRTGPIVGGVLKGDLVIVAAGDPNLSVRILGDTLGFSNEDHSYAGRGDSVARAIGDPLLVMREFAAQLAAKGIKQIEGRILVDLSLFRKAIASLARVSSSRRSSSTTTSSTSTPAASRPPVAHPPLAASAAACSKPTSSGRRWTLRSGATQNSA